MLGLSFITVTASSTIFLPAGLSVALLKSNCGPCSVTSGSAFPGGGGGGGGAGAGGGGGASFSGSQTAWPSSAPMRPPPTMPPPIAAPRSSFRGCVLVLLTATPPVTPPTVAPMMPPATAQVPHFLPRHAHPLARKTNSTPRATDLRRHVRLPPRR